MTQLQKRLYAIADPEYAKFQGKLVPNVESTRFIGVRIPQLRQFAKEFAKDAECETFLRELPHETYDENMLHAILLNNMKQYDDCLEKVEAFLPFVDNWAACDTIRPKAFAKEREKLLPKVQEWICSEHDFTCRFGMDMLMTYYLDEPYFAREQLQWVADVHRDAYYVKMMAAWYFATALAKQWKDAIEYLEEKKLDEWIHKKTIQKACESYRVNAEQKQHLKQICVDNIQ